MYFDVLYVSFINYTINISISCENVLIELRYSPKSTITSNALLKFLTLVIKANSKLYENFFEGLLD